MQLIIKVYIFFFKDGSVTIKSGKGNRAANSERGTTPRKERSSKFNRTKSPK